MEKMLKNFLIIVISFQLTYGSVFDDLFSAQSIAKQDFDRRVVNSTKLNIAFGFPEDKTFQSLDITFKQHLINTFGSNIDQLIDDLIGVGQQSIDAVLEFKNLLKQLIEEFRNLSKTNEFYEEDGQIDKVKQFSEQVLNKWNNFVQSFELIEQNLETKNILLAVETNFFNSIDYQMVNEFLNHFSYEKHPIIEILFEIVEYKSQIINRLFEYSYKNLENDIYFSNPGIKSISCELENLIQELRLKEMTLMKDKINEFIKTKVPPNYQNKLDMAFRSGGIEGLRKVADNMCHSYSEAMALMFMEMTNELFPLNQFSDYEKQYRLFSFIQWIDSTLRIGLNSISEDSFIRNSAEKLRQSLKIFSENTLTQSLDEFKPFGERFHPILEVIENELNRISKDSII